MKTYIAIDIENIYIEIIFRSLIRVANCDTICDTGHTRTVLLYMHTVVTTKN